MFFATLFCVVTHVISETEGPVGDDLRWNLLHKKALEIQLGNAFALFRKHNIEPILIKGWAAARSYPPSEFRHSTDMDLAVSRGDFESAFLVSRSEEARGLAIDLHRELRHLDTVNWGDLMTNSRTIEVEGIEIRVLRPEDHLRVLCTHWLTDGGEYKQRLLDIYYLVERRSADFDWDRCLNSVSKTRRRWIVCTIGLASHFLDLDLTGTPIADEARSLPGWLVKTVEQEWASDVRLRPLYFSLHERKVLFSQIRKRLRANPIQATVIMEGSFDARTRIFYQIGSVFKRLLQSLRKRVAMINLRSK